MSEGLNRAKVLRLFGVEKETITKLLAMANNKTGIRMQSMERGSEFLILLEAETKSGAATLMALQTWEEQIFELCEGAVYGEGETTLSQAMIARLKEEKMTFACADAATGCMVEEKLAEKEGIRNVYDFGAQSYQHPKYGQKIAFGSKFAAKYPSDTAQQVAGRLKVAYECSKADCVISILPRKDGTSLVFMGGKKEFWLHRVEKGGNATLWAFDMLRRTAEDVPQASGTIRFTYGAPILPYFTAQDGEDVDLSPEVQAVPTQSDVDHAPPPEAKGGAATLSLAFLLVVLVAVITLGALYFYTGGDIASLWNGTGLPEFDGSSATLL